MAMLAWGCADRSKIRYKSVAELYQEAVDANRRAEAASAVQIEMSDATGNVAMVETINPVSYTEPSANLARTDAKPQALLDVNSVSHEEPSSNAKADSASETTLTPKQVKQAARQAAKQAARIEALKSSLPADIPVVSSSWNFNQSQAPNTVVMAPELLPGLPVPKAEVRSLINELFEQTDIREAIDIIASTSGETVVVDESIGGVVTLQIKDATFEQALQMLLLPLGLVYVRHQGTYLVSPPEPDSPLFNMISTRRQYAPRNHQPSKLAALVPKRLSQFYQASDDRNLIVIEAPQKIGDDLLSRLQELDLPVEQVILEAIVCVSAPDSGFRFGVDWNHTLQLNNIDQVKVGLTGLAFNGAASKYGVNNAFDDFAVTSAFVQLLAQQGYVTIRAAPRVTAKDGEKASIAIERETFFSLQPTNANLLFRQDVQKVDAGINLMITPRIRGNMVSVEIERAEVSEDIRSSDSRNAQSSNPYPVINRRIVSTKVDIQDGRTIVIGGLVQRQTVDRVSKVPFLGSIPGIGAFFRTVEKQEQDAEVAIFISPRIVRDPYCVPE